MECVFVWLAVMAATFHMAQTQCLDMDGSSYASGDITAAGNQEEAFLTVWVTMCTGGYWRAVCDDGWDTHGARVLCRQMGFSGPAQHCGNSCFGCSNHIDGVTLNCTGTEERLSECRRNVTTRCGSCAGVICIMEQTNRTCDTPLPATCEPPEPATPPATCEPPEPATPPATCEPTTPQATGEPPEPTTPPAKNEPPEPATPPATNKPSEPATPPATNKPPEPATPPATNNPPEPATGTPPTTGDNSTHTRGNSKTPTQDMVGGAQQSCAALGGGLGALTAILAILLVGVVMGWAWSCRRKTQKYEGRERGLSSQEDLLNPTYSLTTSSISPRHQNPSTPSDHTHDHAQSPPPPIYAVVHKVKTSPRPSEGGEAGDDAIYHVLGEEEEGEGIIYHVQGEGEEGEGVIYHVPEEGESDGKEEEVIEDEGEGVYQLLEEVGGSSTSTSSAPSQPAAAQPGGEPMDTEYSSQPDFENTVD